MQALTNFEPSSTGCVTLSSSERRWAALIVALHLVVTVPLAFILNLGTDEGFSLLTTSFGLSEAIQRGLWFELQPPLYFGMLSVWRTTFGESLFAARLLSVICAALVVYFSGGLSRRYLPRIAAPRLMLLMALHPFVIWSAVEIRLYALMLLISVLQLITFHDGFLSGADRTNREEEIQRCRQRVWYLVLATAGLYTHYYSGFLLVANAGVLLILRRWHSVKVYVLSMIVTGVCFAPMLAVVPKQVQEHTDGAAPATLFGATRAVVWQMENLLLPLSIRPTVNERIWSEWSWRAALVAVPLLLFAGTWRSRKRNSVVRPTGWRELGFWSQHVSVLLMTGTLLAICSVAVLVTGPELFEFRHAVSLFVPMMLAACVLAAAIAGNRGVGWWSCAVLCFGVSALGHNYATLSKGGDWKRVARLIESREQKNEPVVVFIPWAALSLEQHYRGANQLLVIPRPEEGLTYRMEEYRLKDEAELDSLVQPVLKEGERLWLVTSGPEKYVGVEFGFDILERWLAGRFDVESDDWFNGSRIRRLKRRSEGSTLHHAIARHADGGDS